MLPTSTSLYMRQPIPVPYNYGSQQPYFSGNSYSPMSHQNQYAVSPLRPQGVQGGMIVPGSSMFTASPMVPSHHIASTSANCDDSPAVTKKFNSYKENREVLPNGSAGSLPFLDELVEVKMQLKEERNLVRLLQEKLASSSQSRDVGILENEIIELRNEKLLSERMDQEHSLKMKAYTQDLMSTSKKYQEDIQTLLVKNESLLRDAEVLRAKCKESERIAAHSNAVQEALNRKILTKDTEIQELSKQRHGHNPEYAKRISELEALVESQQLLIAELEKSDDALDILRSNLILSPGRRVSHLTAAVTTQDCSDWLEPLVIADHVLAK